MNTFYVSEKDDYLLLEDQMLRDFYRELYDSLYSNGYNLDAFYDKINPTIPEGDRRRSDVIIHYHNNYLNVYDTVKSKFEENDLNSMQFVLNRDKRLKAIAFEILPEHISTYLYINMADIFVFGFNNNRMYLLMFVLLGLISFVGLIKQNMYGEILFFFGIAHLLNFILMALSNRVLGRYSFYITFVIFSLLIILFIKTILLEKIRKSNEIL